MDHNLDVNAHGVRDPLDDLPVDDGVDMGEPDGNAIDGLVAPSQPNPLVDGLEPGIPDISTAADPGRLPAAEDPPHGDPDAAAEWSMPQRGAGTCAIASVSMVASQALGAHVDPAELEHVARELGLLDPATTGLTARQTASLLERVGVPAIVEHGTADALRSHLDASRGVILAVDSDEIGGTEDDRLDDGQGVNHALVLTGIDDARGVAIVNDPARVDGAGLELSLERLLDAWADSENEMVVTAAAMEDAAPSSAPRVILETVEVTRGRDPGATLGYVLLPISVGLAALRLRSSGRGAPLL